MIIIKLLCKNKLRKYKKSIECLRKAIILHPKDSELNSYCGSFKLKKYMLKKFSYKELIPNHE